MMLSVSRLCMLATNNVSVALNLHSPFAGISKLAATVKASYSIVAHDYDSDGDLDVILGSPGGTTVIENYASQSYCHDNGVLSTTLNRCSCFTGFSGAQCSMYCPGVAAGGVENICYGHGACRTTGASEGVCLCVAGYGGIDSLNRMACKDCLVPTDPASPID